MLDSWKRRCHAAVKVAVEVGRGKRRGDSSRSVGEVGVGRGWCSGVVDAASSNKGTGRKVVVGRPLIGSKSKWGCGETATTVILVYLCYKGVEQGRRAPVVE